MQGNVLNCFDSTPPTNHEFSDLCEGQAITFKVTVTSQALDDFIRISGDRAPAHTDSLHAQRMGFKAPIVHGLFTGLPFSKILGMYLPGPNCVIQSIDCKFPKGVYIGETLTYEVTIERLIPSVKAVKLALLVTRGKEETVCFGMAQCVFPEQ